MKTLLASLRTLGRKPAYAAVAILTLAVGIGSNSAIFGLLDAIYFRPIPIRGSDQLVQVRFTSPKSSFGMLSYREYEAIRAAVPTFADVVAIGRRGVTIRRNGEARLKIVHYVSGNYFNVLGIPLALGRGLQPFDDTSEAKTATVVINHELWQNQLNGRPDVIGSTIQLNETLFTVVGVTAPGFLGLSRMQRTDVWIAVAQAHFAIAGLQGEVESPYQRWFDVMARVPASSIREAQVQLDTVLARWRSDNLEQYQAATLSTHRFSDDEREAAFEGVGFLGLVGLVLLIACANVANLTLAQSEARRREIAVRSALGASRARIFRQTLSESAVLAIIAAGIGIILAAWLVSLFPALVPTGVLTYVIDIRFDWRLFLFTAVLTAVTAVLVGAIPAWKGSRSDVMSILKDETVGGSGQRQRLRMRDLLIVVQVGISVVVIVSAGLLVRSFARSLEIRPGFDARKNVATFYLSPGRSYDQTQTWRLLEDARRMALSLPAVRRASYGIRLPAQANESGWAADFTVPGKEPPPGESYFRIKYTMVGPDYFEAMGTRILRGRGLLEKDSPDSPGVAVVSETMAERMWPGEDPIGKTIVMGRNEPKRREIVGVAEDIKIAGLYEQPDMYVYVPFAQHPQGFGLLLVETDGPIENIITPFKNGLAQLDKSLPILDIGSFERHLNVVLFGERRDAWIALGISVVALFLGMIGIYSVVSLIVARRRREIGIRIALGAERADVLRLILGHVVRMTGVGLCLGLAGGVIAGRVLQSRLHGVSPVDPWNLAISAAILGSTALIAGFIPCWLSSRTDATQSLRVE
jgi:putative ABC transport system permease protein